MEKIVETASAYCEIIHLAHHAATRPALWANVAGAAGRLLGADAVGFFSHDFLAQRGQIDGSSGITREFCSLYADRIANQNLWITTRRDRPDGAVTSAELVPQWELTRSAFYRQWLRPQGFLHGAIGILARSPEDSQYIIAFRRSDAQGFGPAEKQLIVLLSPYLCCAQSLADEFKTQQALSDMLMGLLAVLPEPIMIVDGDARPVIMSAAAKCLLAQNDGLTLSNGMLQTASAKETASLRRFIAKLANGNDAPISPSPAEYVINRPSGGAPFLLHLALLPPSMVEKIAKRPGVVSVVMRPVSTPTLAPSVCRFYGMTPAETRLAELIVSGQSLFKAATRLGVSRNTARTHMKRIYAKIGVHRQIEIVSVLSTTCVTPRH
jgi:DNA-binding CsgD family transcriptional regulator